MASFKENPRGDSKEEITCIDCDKKNQKELPSDDGISSKGMACEIEYALVSSCMRENSGQISPCKSQWDEFKLCHAKHAKR